MDNGQYNNEMNEVLESLSTLFEVCPDNYYVNKLRDSLKNLEGYEEWRKVADCYLSKPETELLEQKTSL